ncbi:MAG: hypothetical protein WBD20_09540 [Pirellulaceae bacterium]
MMNVTTFTIQSVHGLKQTFVVNPNGTVDTTRQYAESEANFQAQQTQAKPRELTKAK